MIPHVCRVKHDPPNSYGDCVRACVASVLDYENPEDVPHFLHDNCDNDEYSRRLAEWLNAVGLAEFWVYFAGSEPVENILATMKATNAGSYYLLFGASRNESNHCVVGYEDEIIHDPSWTKTGIIGPNSNGFYGVLTFVSAKMRAPKI